MAEETRESGEDVRFVCRREGHVPVLTITKAFGMGDTYFCSCARCGKVQEFPMPAAALSPEGTQE